MKTTKIVVVASFAALAEVTASAAITLVLPQRDAPLGGAHCIGARRGRDHRLNLHEVISADDNDMIYAGTPNEIVTRRKSFIRKWRLKCRGVADSLEEAGELMFIFGRLPDSQWRPARTTNAIERLHEEFKRRINTQTVLPSAETAAMLFSALLASGQIAIRKVDGWQTLAEKPTAQCIDLAA